MNKRRTSSARAAVLTLLLLAGACSPSASGAPSAPVAQPTASAQQATATAAATAEPSAAPSATTGWQRSPDQPSLHDAGLTSAIWTGSRFVATSVAGDPAILDSSDGQTWHRQPPFFTTGRTSPPALVAAGPAGLVAVGGGASGGLAIWNSADGLTWTAAPDQDAFHMHDGAFGGVGAVIATDDGWLAVGGEEFACVPVCLLRGVVLTSKNGLQWARLPDQEALRFAIMTAISRVPEGFLAVGTVMIDPAGKADGLRAAAWSSPDGRAWTRIGSATTFDVPAGWTGDGPTDVRLRSIATHGDRIVVLGDVRPSSGSEQTTYVPPLSIAWWSDGATWTPSKLGGGEDRSNAVAVRPDGFVAVIGSGPTCASGTWRSSDGSSWSCEDDPAFAGFQVWGTAMSTDVELLVGYSLEDPVVGAAWTRALR